MDSTNPEEEPRAGENRSVWEDDEVLRALGASYNHHVELLHTLDNLSASDATGFSQVSGEQDALSPYSLVGPPPVVTISRTREETEDVEESDDNDEGRPGGRGQMKPGFGLIAILSLVGSLVLVIVVFSTSSTFDNMYTDKLKSLVSQSLSINSDASSDHNRLKQNSHLNTVIKKHHAFAVTPSFDNFADISQPLVNGPIFFYRGGGIGGKYVVNIMSKCLGLSHTLHSGTTNPDWIETVSADVVSTYSLHKSSYLCSPTKPGKLFLLMRSPLVDAKQVYDEKKNPFSHYYDPRVTGMNYEDYILSEFMPTSQMCRDICRLPHGELSSACLKDAKKFLRTKVLVGVYEWYEQSLDRFKQFFNWPEFSEGEKQCEHDQFWAVVEQSKSIENLDPSSENYERAKEKLWQTQFCDMALYNYIKDELFHQQAHLVEHHKSLR